MNKKIIKLLYKSFDAPLSENEKEVLAKTLKESEGLRREKEKIIAMREKLASAPAASFKPFFAERVLNRIRGQNNSMGERASIFDSLVAAFKPMAIAAMILLISILFYNLKTTENYTLAGALGKEPVSLEQVVDPVYVLELE